MYNGSVDRPPFPSQNIELALETARHLLALVVPQQRECLPRLPKRPLITVSVFLLACDVSGLFLSPEKVSSLEDRAVRRFVVMIRAVKLEGKISHMYVISMK